MNDLRKAAEQALKVLEEINKLSVGEKAICLPAEIDGAMETLRQALNETPPCKTHPDAPHGFDRNASHNADRYVCECEGWEPVDETAKGKREWVGLTEAERIDIIDDEITAPSTEHFALAQTIEAKLKEKNGG